MADTPAPAKPKRVYGYRITMQVFVPVERNNIQDTVAKAQAVLAAQNGDLSQLASSKVLKFAQRFTSVEGEPTAQLDLEDAEAAAEFAGAEPVAQGTIEQTEPVTVLPMTAAQAETRGRKRSSAA